MVVSLAEAQNHPITPEAFLAADRLVQTAKREQQDASAALARAKKDAKAKSINLTAYKLVEQMRKLEDDERAVVIRLFMSYAGWLDMPLGTQMSLIDAPKMPKPKASAKTEHSVWAAGEAGLIAGRDGEAADSNPHKPGTEHHVAWQNKWADGLGERATAARMLDTEVERVADTATATRKAGQGRGRGRSSGRDNASQNGGALAH